MNATDVVNTHVSGQTVSIPAGQDEAAAIVSDLGTSLNAGRDVPLQAGISSSTEVNERTVTKSGLMGRGGLGFTIGILNAGALALLADSELANPEAPQQLSLGAMGLLDRQACGWRGGGVLVQADQRVESRCFKSASSPLRTSRPTRIACRLPRSHSSGIRQFVRLSDWIWVIASCELAIKKQDDQLWVLSYI